MTELAAVGGLGHPGRPVQLIGHCPAILTAIDLAKRIAPTNIPILIVGETGTGKELLARLIHENSGRHGSLVAVDCGALPDELIESLLFGHRRGAFTGAVEHSGGLVAEANEGTLFLDELGSLSVRGQSKLLRVLETGTVRRVGEARGRSVSFRLVGTAQHGLSDMLREGHFRDDLMQRLAGAVIKLPSLRDRGEDVIRLARHFAGCEGLRLEPAAAATLARRSWPGNVRELRWMVARCALFATNETIDVRAVGMALEVGPGQLASDGPITADPSSATQLRAVCRQHRGDADRVARALGIAKSTLYRRLKIAGIRLRAFRSRAESA